MKIPTAVVATLLLASVSFGQATPKSSPGTQKQVDKLATRFNVPPSEVQSLRSQGLGWGEIKDALAISQKAGVPVSDVVARHKAGKGWGRIAKGYGFTLGSAVGKGGERAERGEHEPHEGHEMHGGRH